MKKIYAGSLIPGRLQAKKLIISAGLLAATFSTQAQTVYDTVSVGANYANHKFYSLQNDEQGTQSKDNWDIAFEITGFTSAILANTQKTNFALYRAPYTIANYATVDTAGISGWPVLYNSDTTWATGAFNRGADPNNPYDLGWGIYDLNTHYVMGDSCYVVKLSATSYKKLKIVSLISGVYTFEYANLNGTASQTATINKTTYTGKNFAYFDMTGNVAVDREPLAANWDLMFGRYTAFVPVAYPVAGVLANKNVAIAQLNDVANPSTYNTWVGAYLSSNISTIGHDWKTVDINTNTWKIVNDTIFFVKDRSNAMWKMRFTGFGGSANGNYIFSKEKLSATGIANAEGNIFSQMVLYPNPSTGENTTLIYSSESDRQNITVSLVDINGRVVSQETINANSGLNRHQINTATLNSGVYFVRLNAGSYNTTQKLIKY